MSHRPSRRPMLTRCRLRLQLSPAALPSMGGGVDVEDEADAADRPENPAFDAIWARVCASAGKDLRTRDGEAFLFKADEKAAHPNVVDYPIARSSFERAFELSDLLEMVEDG